MFTRRHLELSNHKINTKWNSKQLSYVIPNIILGGDSTREQDFSRKDLQKRIARGLNGRDTKEWQTKRIRNKLRTAHCLLCY
jgi:hypothetical protein